MKQRRKMSSLPVNRRGLFRAPILIRGEAWPAPRDIHLYRTRLLRRGAGPACHRNTTRPPCVLCAQRAKWPQSAQSQPRRTMQNPPASRLPYETRLFDGQPDPPVTGASCAHFTYSAHPQLSPYRTAKWSQGVQSQPWRPGVRARPRCLPVLPRLPWRERRPEPLSNRERRGKTC
jgi:hypothetical protein